MTTGNGTPYDIDYSAAVLQQLKELRDRAQQAGKANEFRTTLGAIYAGLRNEPRQLGDPLFEYPNSSFTLYRATRLPLVVFYAVHRDQPLVVIQKVVVYPEGIF